jgi:hypothetical protein
VIDESFINFNSVSLDLDDDDLMVRMGERFVRSLQLRGIPSGSTADKVHTLVGDVIPGSDDDRAAVSSAIDARDGSLRISLVNRLPFNRRNFEDIKRTQITVNDKFLIGASRESAVSPSFTSLSSETQIIDPSSLGKRVNEIPVDAESNPSIETKYLVNAEAVTISASGEMGEIQSSAGKLNSSIVHVGYLLEKFEGSQPNPVKTFVVPANVSYFLDDEIKYGAQYTYAVRTIAAFAFTEQDDNPQVTETNPAEIKKTTVLVKSRPTSRASVITSEEIPPPPPADLAFLWNYDNSTMTLVWAFPFNPQRDIKEWQIFRRSSIDEPFRLIRVINFDDSVVPAQRFEDNIDPIQVRRPTVMSKDGPVPVRDSKFTDPEFKKDSKFIYAVCSVDAHSFISNYSEQFEISFDRIKNRLVKRLISPSGAPKQYPNTFLNAELSLDSAVSSGMTKMKLYFDPEYLKVVRRDLTSPNKQETDLRLLRDTQLEDDLGTISQSGPGCMYKLVLLNTDRQKQQTVNIGIRGLEQTLQKQKA